MGMKLALENASGSVFELSDQMIAEGLEASRQSPRLRMLLPIHRRQEDLVQRMINFMQPGTYLQPHLHPRDSASETMVVFRGALGFLQFSSEGEVMATHRLGPGGLIDLVPGIWHSVVVLAPDTVIGEFKRGPYTSDDKTFAEWAPAEEDSEARRYLRFMESRFETETEED